MAKPSERKQIKNPPIYRLDFIKENTFNRVWSISMSRTRVIVGALIAVAASLALLWCIMAFTPLRQLLPGTMRGDVRARYIQTALMLDSLEQAAQINNYYLSNIMAVMKGDLPVVTTAPPDTATLAKQVIDSLLTASETERRFVRSYEEEERFNLSVLAPIAAEGMVFTSPVAGSPEVSETANGVDVKALRGTPVSAIYRGTVVGIWSDGNGNLVVAVQHPNDFISVYSGLRDVYVDAGKKISAGQRIGVIGPSGAVVFELWHNGSALDPRRFIDIVG